MDWFILIGSLALVTLGAELLVRGASLLALRLGISPLFVGLTIVGFGTSSPELAASLSATLAGSGGVAVGNVIGSNIFNIGLIVGLTALIRPIRIKLRAVRRDLMVAIAAAAAPLLALAFDGMLPRWIGFALLTMLAAYVIQAFRTSRRAGRDEQELAREEVIDTVAVPKAAQPRGLVWLNLLLIVVGFSLLIFGSRWFVTSAIDLARTFGISDLLIGLTIVSAGTSMPELITSLVAGSRRNPDIAIGNIIGSNIFNIFGILGLSTAVQPLRFSPSLLYFDIPVMLIASLCLLPIIRSRGGISRLEGAALLCGYAAYLTYHIVGNT